MTRTITRAEYDSSAQHEYARPAASLMPETLAAFRQDLDWDGEYWQLHNGGSQGTALSPVNIR